MRFFALNNRPTSGLVVQVVYTVPLLGVVSVPVGTVSSDATWQPTAAMQTLAAIVSSLSGGTAEVALRFTALGGPSQIDDVFVDPRGYK